MAVVCAVVSPAVPLHAHVTPVSALLGHWIGGGEGVYPTIQTFQYEEEFEFLATNKIFVSYTQRTWLAGSGRTKAMHEENGFLRFLPDQKVEALITQCTGVQEILLGSYKKNEQAESITIELVSTGLTRVPSAKPPHVTQVKRVYTFDLDGDSLSYQIFMATEKTPELTLHLTGKHGRKPTVVADDDEEEEEALEDKFLEPDVKRHPEHPSK